MKSKKIKRKVLKKVKSLKILGECVSAFTKRDAVLHNQGEKDVHVDKVTKGISEAIEGALTDYKNYLVAFTKVAQKND